MNVFAISDTHNGRLINLPEICEVFIHAGDLSDQWSNHNQFLDWSKNMHSLNPNLKEIVFCPGNHDFWAEDSFSTTSFVLNKLTFVLFPWVPNCGDWAFTAPKFDIHENFLREKLDVVNNVVPEVLVTHGPPFNCVDETWDNRLAGSYTVRDYIARHKDTLKAVICGHIHEQGRQVQELYGVPVYNVAQRLMKVKL